MGDQIMEPKGKLIIFSAPSGAGKGAIITEYLKRHPNIKFSISCTTRGKTKDDGENSYIFLSQEEFLKMKDNNEFLECDKSQNEDWYGTPKRPVLDNLEKGNDVLLEINYVGALQIKKNYPQAIIIFILPPSLDELHDRLVKRGRDSEDSIRNRFKKSEIEIKNANNYDYIVTNDDLMIAVSKIEAIVNSCKNQLICSEFNRKIVKECKANYETNIEFINELLKQYHNIDNPLILPNLMTHYDAVAKTKTPISH